MAGARNWWTIETGRVGCRCSVWEITKIAKGVLCKCKGAENTEERIG